MLNKLLKYYVYFQQIHVSILFSKIFMLQPTTTNQLSLPAKLEDQLVRKFGHDNIAYLFWLIASLLFVSGFLFCNENNVDSVGSLLSRGVSLFLFNALVVYWRPIQNQKSQYKTLNQKSTDLLNIRHIIQAFHGLMLAEAQFYLPLPVIYTIYFSGPIFVLMMEYYIYGQKITKTQTTGVALAILGVLLTTNGQLIETLIMGNSQASASDFQNYKSTDPFIRLIVVAIMILMTFAWAYSIVVVREIQMNDHYEANLNFGMCLAIIGGICYCFIRETIFDKSFEIYILAILYHGIPLTVAQIFFMQALLLTKKLGLVVMIGFLGVIFSYSISILRYNEEINLICIGGGVIVMVGLYKTIKI